MWTELQIAANRLNVQKSTGPKTPECRAAVRLNRVKSISDDDPGRLGLVVTRTPNKMATFNRQESRLERAFYRTVHELQRLRKLALVSPRPVVQVPDLPSNEINNVQVANPQPDPQPNPPPRPAARRYAVDTL